VTDRGTPLSSNIGAMDSLIKIFTGVLSGEQGSRCCRKDNNEKITIKYYWN
jgi:hypothetical protein